MSTLQQVLPSRRERPWRPSLRGESYRSIAGINGKGVNCGGTVVIGNPIALFQGKRSPRTLSNATRAAAVETARPAPWWYCFCAPLALLRVSAVANQS